MRSRLFFLLMSWFYTNAALSQCPERDTLWNRLTYLSSISGTEISQDELKSHLNELVDYEARIQSCPYRNDTTHALLLQRIGVLYFKQGEIVQAIHYTRKSNKMVSSHALKPSMDERYLIKNYYILSQYFAQLNNQKEKNAAIDSCVSIATRLKAGEYYYLFSLSQKLERLFNIGDYNRCYQYAVMGESAIREFARSSDSINYVMNFLTLKVNVLLNFKRYSEAEKLLINKMAECRKVGARQYLGTIAELLARCYASQPNMPKAAMYFDLAVQYHEAAGLNIGSMQVLNTLGYTMYFKHYRNSKKAIETYKKALLHTSDDQGYIELQRMEMLNIYTNIANVYVHDRKFDSAFHYYKVAFDQVAPGKDENNISGNMESFMQNSRTGYLTALVIDKGKAFLERYKSEKKPEWITRALAIFKIGDRLLDRIKADQSEMQSKLFWRADSRRLYEYAIEACYLTNNIADAFYFFEKSRAVLLHDQLNEQNWLEEGDILVQTQIKKKILQLETAQGKSTLTPVQLAESQRKLITLKQQQDRLITSIKNRNPLYYQNFLDTGFVTLQHVQQQILRGHQSLVEIFSGDSAVYLLTVTETQAQLSKINKPDYEKTVGEYVSFISSPALLNNSYHSFTRSSHQLYKLLFPNKPLPIGRVIISPDGQYFPLEALVTSNAKQPLKYFVNDYAVSYSYSARFLMNQFTTPTEKPSRTFMGVAPVEYGSYVNLASLPGSKQAVNQLQSWFSTADILTEGDASKRNFLNSYYKYEIVQLYAHAADSGSTGEPVIYFADSALVMPELLPSGKMSTKLIVLSACNTGTGRWHKGEGVFSFNREFAALGIPASITTLWAVDDASTYAITNLFYEYLAEGMPADIALQKAKVSFMETADGEKKLPSYWAASILAGDSNAVKLSKPKTLEIILALIAIAGLSVWIARIVSKR